MRPALRKGERQSSPGALNVSWADDQELLSAIDDLPSPAAPLDDVDARDATGVESLDGLDGGFAAFAALAGMATPSDASVEAGSPRAAQATPRRSPPAPTRRARSAPAARATRRRSVSRNKRRASPPAPAAAKPQGSVSARRRSPQQTAGGTPAEGVAPRTGVLGAVEARYAAQAAVEAEERAVQRAAQADGEARTVLLKVRRELVARQTAGGVAIPGRYDALVRVMLPALAARKEATRAVAAAREARIAELELHLAAERRRVEELQESGESGRGRISELEKQLTSANERIEALSEQLARTEQDLAAAASVVGDRTQQINAVGERAQVATAEADEARRVASAAEAHANEMRDGIIAAEALAAHERDKTTSLERSLVAARAEVAVRGAAVEKLKQELAEAQEASVAMRKRFDGEVAARDKWIADLQSDLREAEGRADLSADAAWRARQAFAEKAARLLRAAAGDAARRERETEEREAAAAVGEIAKGGDDAHGATNGEADAKGKEDASSSVSRSGTDRSREDHDVAERSPLEALRRMDVSKEDMVAQIERLERRRAALQREVWSADEVAEDVDWGDRRVALANIEADITRARYDEQFGMILKVVAAVARINEMLGGVAQDSVLDALARVHDITERLGKLSAPRTARLQETVADMKEVQRILDGGVDITGRPNAQKVLKLRSDLERANDDIAAKDTQISQLSGIVRELMDALNRERAQKERREDAEAEAAETPGPFAGVSPESDAPLWPALRHEPPASYWSAYSNALREALRAQPIRCVSCGGDWNGYVGFPNCPVGRQCPDCDRDRGLHRGSPMSRVPFEEMVRGGVLPRAPPSRAALARAAEGYAKAGEHGAWRTLVRLAALRPGGGAETSPRGSRVRLGFRTPVAAAATTAARGAGGARSAPPKGGTAPPKGGTAASDRRGSPRGGARAARGARRERVLRFPST